MAVNPYDSNNPVSPQDFAGRRDLKNRIENYILTSIAERPQNVALVGGWGTGKTSLIDVIKPFARKKNCLIVDIDVSESETTGLADLYHQLLNAIRVSGIELASDTGNKGLLKACENIEDSTKAGVNYVKDSYPGPVFQIKLKEVWEALSRFVSLIILILDNAEYLTKIKGILMELRSIFQRLNRQNAKYLLVLSTKPTLFSDVKQTVEPTSRFVHYLPLGNFDLEETEEAIIKPLSNRKIKKVKFVKEAIQFIYDKSQGHPFFVKLLCHHFFDLTKGGGTVNLQFVTKHHKELMQRLIDDKLGRDFERLPDGEKEILISACSLGDIFTNKELEKVVTVANVNDALKRLVQKESGELVTKFSRGKYSIYHPLFKEFLIWLFSESDQAKRVAKYIPSGRIIKGENAVEHILAKELVNYTKICDEWFNYKAIEFLEVIPSRIKVKILSSKTGDDNQKNQLRRKLKRLSQKMSLEIELRYASEFPFHIRYILTHKKGWQLSHSLKDLGKKASYISTILTDLEEIESDFDKTWSKANRLFP